jgi:hypothetical protein
VLQSNQTITNMPDLQDEPVAYIIRNEAYPTEYFLLENRQPQRWGTYVKNYSGMHGMLVCHVDEDEEAWRKNIVNKSPSHQRMTIIPANQTYGSWQSSTYHVTAAQYSGQLFPGSEDITLLDSLSHPKYGGTLFHNNTHGTKALPFSLSDITESDGLISFHFSTPNTQPSSIDSRSLNNNHSPLNSQHYYTLQGVRIAQPRTPGVYLTGDRKIILIQ